ncbi:aromatic ring-hydroxylating oxygenase subunit alpha [Paraburkholderia phenoliruptrix]|uniref:aromatic ring-hydroxylating oxygenase subunit alpha n=1 Tax=Paraburkholderia phenoliruptrix TaxID=252970 RepID=UPI00286997D1|nr:aromatic ring-hydroxylating dioxygenase subunit alpha [Paraburkholderia phenoliruptrix]WMY11065.1 aromatic ring-hydroxylating dioxygenase subunit alpha [Paraburkholderia phenoliruptrix]
MLANNQLASLIDSRQPGRSLPQPFYNDPAVFERDLELIWERQWLFAGVAAQIPKTGNWFTVEVGSSSIVVVRDKTKAIRAYYNTCRHRGSRICSGEKGSSATFSCPYHQWTYGLDGKLLFAKEMGEEFDASEYSLNPVRCESVDGYIFISLAENPTPFEQFREQVSPYIKPHGLENAKVAFESTIVEKGNWKLVLENNRECYHCNVSHPELLRTISEFDGPTDPRFGGEYAEKCATDEARWEASGLPFKPIETDEGYRLVRVAMERGLSFTMNGELACKKLLGTIEDQDVGSLRLLRFPNTWNHVLSDHAIAFRVLPLSATETQVTTWWLVNGEAVEGEDYDLENLTAVWKATNAQDQRLVEANQQGINSKGYRPGPYSPLVERGVTEFIDWYLTTLKEELNRRRRSFPCSAFKHER